MSREEWLQANLASGLACRDKLAQDGANLAFYTTAQNVADLNALRLGMGYSQVNLLGSGYGYILALRLLQEDPQAVRSLALSNAFDPQASFPTIAAHLQRALNLVFQRCAADEKCRAAYPDLEKEFYAAVDRLNASPVTVSARLYPANRAVPVVVNGDTLVSLAPLMLSTNEVIAQFPGAIVEINQDRTSRLEMLLSAQISQYQYADPGPGMSVYCETGIPEQGGGNPSGQIHPSVQQEQDNTLHFYREICPKWYPQPPRNPGSSSRSSAVPILIVQGEFNASLPLADLKASVKDFKKITLVEFPGAGSFIEWTQPCLTQMVSAFLKSPGGRLDTSCIESVPALRVMLLEKGGDLSLPGLVVKSNELYPNPVS